MNLFEYRNGKDLKARVDARKPKDIPQTKPLLNAQEAAKYKQQRKQSNHNVKRKVTDPTYNYGNPVEVYRRQSSVLSENNIPKVFVRPGESEDKYHDRRERIHGLLNENDWFSMEVIMDGYRRHPMHLLYITKLAWVLIPLTIMLFVGSGFFPPLIAGAIFFMIITVLYLAYRFIDWRNDYLIVTNMRIIHLEDMPFVDTDILEIPLPKVQELRIETRSNALEYLFQVGTVTVVSSGRTEIVFKRMHRPERIREGWNELRKLYMRDQTDFRRKRVRNYMENKIWGSPLENWYEGENARELEVTDNPNFWQKLFPSRPKRDRSSGELVWHTHPWILVKKALRVFLGFAVLVLLGLFGLPFVYLVGNALLSTVVSVIYFAGFFAVFAWLWYQYTDWYNDRYILGLDKIRDVKRLPFGFDENIGVIELRNIQDINSEEPGVMAKLLKFGEVRISTAGNKDATVFKNVPEPREIKNEVLRRKEILRLKDEEVQDRLSADFFATYREILLNPPDHIKDAENPGGPGHR